jgi:hypothetical protein
MWCGWSVVILQSIYKGKQERKAHLVHIDIVRQCPAKRGAQGELEEGAPNGQADDGAQGAEEIGDCDGGSVR